jgi:hypothetical protein
MNILKVIIALGLLWFVFYGSIPSIDINTIPDEVDEVAEIIDVEKPSDETIKKVRPVAALVTDVEDRAKLALFNYEFAQRVKRYETSSQQLNDVYAEAAKLFFENSMVNKYEGFSDDLLSLFKDIVGDKNHILSTDEKDALSELFSGFAWALVEEK